MDARRNVDVCWAWDTEGRPIGHGDFRLEDEDRPATASELHPSMIEAITQKDMLAGRQQEIQAERDRKLEEARKQRQIRRQQAS